MALQRFRRTRPFLKGPRLINELPTGRAGPGRGRGAAPEPAAPLPEGWSGLRGGPGPCAGRSPRLLRTAPPRRFAPEGSRVTRVTGSGTAGMDTQPELPLRADASLLGITPRAKSAAGRH
nr:KH domain-containing, RNA-binding, signal transduction-associated protein 1-like [Taeniopygia guttata]